ncbi:MAG: ABC transporter ATP-binding protein, partial [Ignisphaera sp.]
KMVHFIEMREISKRFGDVQALDNVSIYIDKNEVVGLLGENGAGKTTLMNILYGLYKADKGEIFIEGKKVKIRSPKDALSYKIVMVHQHFKLIPNFTVIENILLGSVKGMKLNLKTYEEELSKISREFGLDVDLYEKVRELPVGIRQRVEILRALFRGARLLILDEPTTNLTPQEVDVLLSALKRMTKAGLSIVFITHKVKEAMKVADRIIVLKAGKLMGVLDGALASEEKLIELMMGVRDVKPLVLFSNIDLGSLEPPKEEVLIVENLKVQGEKGEIVVNNVSFTLRRGEILGVAGVSGNGQRELVEALAGIRRPASGKILINGIEITGAPPAKIFQMGVFYIPEDRIGDGLLPTMSVSENVILGHHNNPPFKRGILMDWNIVHRTVEKYVKEFKVKAQNVGIPAGTLSGGNIQKLQIIRALIREPKIILAHNPTRGLDIATVDMILRKFLELRNKGASILLISEDLDELMSICDRIMVMYKGEVMGIIRRENFDLYKIGAMMAGMRGAQ